MKLTPKHLEDDTTIANLFTEHRSWHTWRTTRDLRRPTNAPALLALHAPTRQLLAVHVRPRRLHPSERPSDAHTPAVTAAVVWTPTMRRDIATWLNLTAGDPPGLLAGTWWTP